MNNDEFKSQIMRLIDCYGPRFYPEERVKAIYNQFRHIDLEVFKRAISFLIAENLYAPVLTKIRDAVGVSLGEYRHEKKERLKEEMENYKCSLCKNTGAIIAYKDSFSYAFQCDCKIGNFVQNNWPTWTEELNFEYERVDMPEPNPGFRHRSRIRRRHGDSEWQKGR